jgi:hypothetical protein
LDCSSLCGNKTTELQCVQGVIDASKLLLEALDLFRAHNQVTHHGTDCADDHPVFTRCQLTLTNHSRTITNSTCTSPASFFNKEDVLFWSHILDCQPIALNISISARTVIQYIRETKRRPMSDQALLTWTATLAVLQHKYQPHKCCCSPVLETQCHTSISRCQYHKGQLQSNCSGNSRANATGGDVCPLL